MNHIEYKYAGQPLTAGIAAELVQELFSGRIAERHKIVDAVVQAHRERTGLDARANDTSGVVKKALSNLAKAELADNPSHGQWRIKPANPADATHGVITPEADQPTIEPPLAAELVVGEGDESVYLYYFESYRRLAEIETRPLFPCKIGRSERDPLLRVLSQASTALPEYPKISRLFRTNDGSALEAAIHAILSLRGREVETSPGTEWFLTSPDEVDQIVRFIRQE